MNADQFCEAVAADLDDVPEGAAPAISALIMALVSAIVGMIGKDCVRQSNEDVGKAVRSPNLRQRARVRIEASKLVESEGGPFLRFIAAGQLTRSMIDKASSLKDEDIEGIRSELADGPRLV